MRTIFSTRLGPIQPLSSLALVNREENLIFTQTSQLIPETRFIGSNYTWKLYNTTPGS